ncbi:MAG: pentapeptide repeat-containing protein [Magnetococcales bacterium]|nr:pentapeptide repeat-containing protein [Magnetococcales bacterium]
MQPITDKAQLLATYGRDGQLRGADLSFIEIRTIDFRGVDLTGAILVGSRLYDVCFDQCQMSEIHLQETLLQQVSFLGSRMDHAFCQRSQFPECRFDDADLAYSRFLMCNLEAVSMCRANLQMAQLLACQLDRVDLTGADLQRASLRESTLDHTRFIACNLAGADLRKTNLYDAYYEQVATEGAIYYGKSPWDGQNSVEPHLGRKIVVFDGE